MYRLIIPRTYLNIFSYVEINDIDLTIDDNIYKLRRSDIILNHSLFDNIDPKFPIKWFQEIQNVARTTVDDILLKFREDETCNMIILYKKSPSIILKYKNSYLEIDRLMGKACPDLNARLNHIIKFENYINIDVVNIPDNFITDHVQSLNRYFIYDSTWLETSGSSGGGNITSLIDSTELIAVLKENQIFNQVGDTNYRLTKEFISLLKEMNEE